MKIQFKNLPALTMFSENHGQDLFRFVESNLRIRNCRNEIIGIGIIDFITIMSYQKNHWNKGKTEAEIHLRMIAEYAKEFKVLLVKYPEMFLHIREQKGFLDLYFKEFFEGGSHKGCKMILCTQSPAVINGNWNYYHEGNQVDSFIQKLHLEYKTPIQEM